jgi:hypothetical protein
MTVFNLTPEQLGRFTLPQLACLASEKPIDAARQVRSKAEYLEYLKEVEAYEASWSEFQ